MVIQQAKERAAKALLARIGPSVMPIETGHYSINHPRYFGCVWAFDPETGTKAVYQYINRNRLRLVTITH